MFFFQPLSQFEANLYTEVTLNLTTLLMFYLNFNTFVFDCLNPVVPVTNVFDPFNLLNFEFIFYSSFDFSVESNVDISGSVIMYCKKDLIFEYIGLVCYCLSKYFWHIVINILYYFSYSVSFFLSLCAYSGLLDSMNYLSSNPYTEYSVYIVEDDINSDIFIDISINKFYSTVFFLIIIFLLFFVYFFFNYKIYKVDWHFVVFDRFDKFLTDTIIQQLGIKKGQIYSISLKSVFYLVLLSNIFGLIPFSFTITSHLIFTFSLSCSILLGITILGFLIHDIKFLKILVPGGAPVFLLPLLVPIEFISYVARCFSLAIRLFANMMSGHTLLNILSGFVLKIFKNGFLIFSLVPLFVVLAVLLLELVIAFLQAYVFLVLFCIYLKDAFEISH